MPIHEIKNRWSGAVIYSGEHETMRDAVKAAIEAGLDLRGLDLRGLDLRGLDLRGSDLRGSNLSGSDLRGSNLRGSNLRGSDLRGSNLSGSDLRGSNLRGSDLSGSDLSDSNLRDSNLRDSNLTPIRDDIWAVLCSAPKEAVALRNALAAGQVNGSAYRGDCGFGCLVGTLALARGCTEFEIPGLRPNSDRPAERFFLAIKLDDTPETSQFSRLALEWVDEWIEKMRNAFTTAAV